MPSPGLSGFAAGGVTAGSAGITALNCTAVASVTPPLSLKVTELQTSRSMIRIVEPSGPTRTGLRQTVYVPSGNGSETPRCHAVLKKAATVHDWRSGCWNARTRAVSNHSPSTPAAPSPSRRRCSHLRRSCAAGCSPHYCKA